MQELSPSTLNPAQQSVMDHALLDSGFSCVLQMPTGSGKTWLSKVAIRKSLDQDFRGIYLTPLRALAEELATRWKSEFSDVPVGIFTGDYGRAGSDFPTPYKDARVMIMTPERLDACTRHWRTHWNWIPEVDWVVVDELHLLGDPGRGARLEGALSRLRRLNPFCRVLGLSATLGNREELADWLQGVEFHSTWRPVPLSWRISRYKKADEKPDLAAKEVAATRDQGGQSIIFVQSRRRSESLARHLSSQGLVAGYHHAGLAHRDRRSVEEAFRLGSTQVLVATGTLEMGLNLPVRQVVLYDLQAFDGSGFSPLRTSTVWQRAGRAGRPGLDTEGEAVLLAPTWDRDVDRYPTGQFEHISSGFHEPAALAEQILVEVQSGMARSRTQVSRVFAQSLAVHQTKALPLEKTLQAMLDAGMLKEVPARENHSSRELRLAATPLGRIAVRHHLAPQTILHLTGFLERHQSFTFLDLVVACACTCDIEPVLSVDFEDLESLADSLASESSFVLQSNPQLRKEVFPVSGKRLLSALKTASVLSRWTSMGDLDAVAEDESCYPFEIQRLQESMDRLLLAVAGIQRLIDEPTNEGEPNKAETCKRPKSVNLRRIELWRQMILTGLEEEPASLALIDGIGPKWAQKLCTHGIKNLNSLGIVNSDELGSLPGLSTKRAAEWIAQAQIMSGDLLPEIEAPCLRITPVEADCPVDPYRLRRALDLQCLSRGKDTWIVSGGLEPHQVQRTTEQWHCDCADFSKGHLCKHILKVRHFRGDPILTAAINRMHLQAPSDWLDLFSLWFDR
jgi:helicase